MKTIVALFAALCLISCATTGATNQKIRTQKSAPSSEVIFDVNKLKNRAAYWVLYCADIQTPAELFPAVEYNYRARKEIVEKYETLVGNFSDLPASAPTIEKARVYLERRNLKTSDQETAMVIAYAWEDHLNNLWQRYQYAQIGLESATNEWERLKASDDQTLPAPDIPDLRTRCQRSAEDANQFLLEEVAFYNDSILPYRRALSKYYGRWSYIKETTEPPANTLEDAASAKR